MSIESMMPSNHLILYSPRLLLPSIFPSIRVFPMSRFFPISCAKYWIFSFSISPFNEYSGLIFFRIDWFDPLAVQGTLKSLLQCHNLKASILWCSESGKVEVVIPLHCKVYWRRQWHPTPVLLPGKSHGRRSLEGCNPWGHWGLDMTEQLHFYFSLSCIGEGNGNPFQCSCLENPRDGGAWWAAIYGVAQSRTRLKWLSISISSM